MFILQMQNFFLPNFGKISTAVIHTTHLTLPEERMSFLAVQETQRIFR